MAGTVEFSAIPMSNVPGVFKNKSNRGYQAKVQINGKRIYLGTFTTKEEALKAYLDRKRG